MRRPALWSALTERRQTVFAGARTQGTGRDETPVCLLAGDKTIQQLICWLWCFHWVIHTSQMYPHRSWFLRRPSTSWM